MHFNTLELTKSLPSINEIGLNLAQKNVSNSNLPFTLLTLEDSQKNIYAKAGLLYDPNLNSIEVGGMQCIEVAKDFRGKGFGTEMLRMSIQKAIEKRDTLPTSPTIFLKVPQDNKWKMIFLLEELGIKYTDQSERDSSYETTDFIEFILHV